MSSLRRLLKYLRPEIGSLAAAYMCMMVLAATTAFYAFLSGPALGFVFTGDVGVMLRGSDGELRSLWQLVPTGVVSALEALARTHAVLVIPVLVVVTAVIKGVAQTGQFYLLGRTSQRALKALRADAFAAMLGQSMGFFDRRAHGDLVSRLTNDANLVEQGLFYGFSSLLREPLVLVALLGFCFYTDPKLASFTFITVPLAALPLARFARWLKRVAHRGQRAQGEINAVAHEALTGARVVQAFGTERVEQQKLSRAGLAYYRQMLRSYFIRAVRTPTMEILGAIALAGLLGLLGSRVRQGSADPTHYINFFAAIVLMYDPLKTLGRVSDYLAAGAAATDRIFEIIDLQPAIRDRAGATALPGFRERVVFDRVTFAYNETPVLQGVELELPAGSLVALVGASGAGKTTLAHLLPRFYDATGGSVLVDGRDVRDVTLSSLRGQIGMVSQDTFLFNTSVADNIAYGTPGASLSEIRAAARAAYAEEFIERLSQGYDTVIGERGVTLSGGQRQRLAIARALLRNTPLLILDEATSSLDIESERFVQEALETLMQGRTSLVIAHRLSTVQRADLIAVLRDGRIVERGRHRELLDRGGEYARLYNLQFRDLDRPHPEEAEGRREGPHPPAAAQA